MALNTYVALADIRMNHWEADRQLVTRIASAMDSLTDDIPHLISGFYRHVEYNRSLESVGSDFDNLSARERLARIKGMTDPLMELGAAEHLQYALANMKRFNVARVRAANWEPYHKWEGFARELVILFHKTFLGQKKAAGYRFVQHVVTNITGEKPTFEAIQTYLKRDRPISPRRRKVVGKASKP